MEVQIKSTQKKKKKKELLIRLVIMGAITGELSFRSWALTLSQPGALFEDRLLIILCTLPVVMVEMQIREYCLDRSWIRLARIKSLCHEC